MTENNSITLLEQLFDERAFTEIQAAPESGVIAGFGVVAGRGAYVYVQDIKVKSGAVNKNAAAKIKKVYNAAVKFGKPVIAVFDSKGGEISEGLELIDAYSEIIENCARLSGVVPLISIVTGQCSGLTGALCRMSDFVVMTREASMFFTPPFVGGDKTGVSGTAEFNARKGAADLVVENSEEAVLKTRALMSLLPPNNLEPAFCADFTQNNANITDTLKSIELITALSDENSVIEICGDFGTACVTAFGVLNGLTIGFVAVDNTLKLNGGDAAKIARFVCFCDAFSLPVITITDNEGFESCTEADFIRDTARLAQIYASATIPKISLITGKATGAAFIITGGLRGDFVLAYENAVISPINTKAVSVFLGVPESDYIKESASVDNALKKGYIDMVITPDGARTALITALNAVRDKRTDSPKRKHINYVF